MKKHMELPDLMKGLAIFLVVMGHVLTMCIREIDRAPLFKFIGEVHMPLFFFLSGFLALRRGADGTVARPPLLRRALRLLLPMVAVSTLWIYRFPHTGLESPMPAGWSGLWGDIWKNGYWFTLVLFEIIVMYIPAALMLGHLRRLWAQIAAMAAYSLAVAALVGLLPQNIACATSLPLAAGFMPVYLAGAICADRRDTFMDWCRRPPVMTVAIVTTALLMHYVCWFWEYPSIPSGAVDFARPLLHISLAVLACGVLYGWSLSGTPSVRLWCFLGRKSLAIYLLHYFFLFPMGFVRPWLESMSLAIVPLAALSASVAALIVASVLAVDYVLGFSVPLSVLFTGAAIPQKEKNT